MSEMADAIRALAAEKGISEDSIKKTVENMIKAAYKKTYGTADNCIVKFSDDMSDVSVYSRKVIVDGVYDPSQEIELEDALKLSPEAQEGYEIDILVDPKDFNRTAVATGKQTAHQDLNENYKDSLYKEFKDKVGEVIIGYYRREQKGNIYLDIGNVEGCLPSKYQSPRETFSKNDRIKTYVKEVKKDKSGIKVTLSRTDSGFVEKILTNEVPEIGDHIVVIHKIVREAGYRTKVAVYSTNADVDPLGACVGHKGGRIQNVIQELYGEKIDVLKYDEDPHIFIKNALSPAEIKKVIITDPEKKTALAIVADSQYSLAIGKMGQNVRLANKLCDWSIDVKTESEVEGLDLTETTSRAAEQLFSDDEYEEVTSVSQLPGVDSRVAKILVDVGYGDIEKFVEAAENGLSVEGLTEEEINTVSDIINETVQFEDVDDSTEDTESEEESYRCPECGAVIDVGMHKCPKCGVELEFEEE